MIDIVLNMLKYSNIISIMNLRNTDIHISIKLKFIKKQTEKTEINMTAFRIKIYIGLTKLNFRYPKGLRGRFGGPKRKIFRQDALKISKIICLV